MIRYPLLMNAVFTIIVFCRSGMDLVFHRGVECLSRKISRRGARVNHWLRAHVGVKKKESRYLLLDPGYIR